MASGFATAVDEQSAAKTAPCRPFLKTGVDYAGPILLRSARGRGTSHLRHSLRFLFASVHGLFTWSRTTQLMPFWQHLGALLPEEGSAGMFSATAEPPL